MVMTQAGAHAENSEVPDKEELRARLERLEARTKRVEEAILEVEARARRIEYSLLAVSTKLGISIVKRTLEVVDFERKKLRTRMESEKEISKLEVRVQEIQENKKLREREREAEASPMNFDAAAEETSPENLEIATEIVTEETVWHQRRWPFRFSNLEQRVNRRS
ncbi:hypothetical protein OROGR_029233 [Orobanche gracilis]